MQLGRIIIGGVLAVSLLTIFSACKKQEERQPFVPPYDGDDMAYTPIDQSVLLGVWKTEDGSSVIEVSGDEPRMVVTENRKLIFEGNVRLKKYGALEFTDVKDDGSESYLPYMSLTFNSNENTYSYLKLFDGDKVTFTKQPE